MRALDFISRVVLHDSRVTSLSYTLGSTQACSLLPANLGGMLSVYPPLVSQPSNFAIALKSMYSPVKRLDSLKCPLATCHPDDSSPVESSTFVFPDL